MIYLIRTAHLVINEDNTYSTKPVLKIGYSSDPTGMVRFRAYEFMGPIMVLARIQEDEANEELEKALHYHFKEYLIYKKEWYSDSKEIVEFFNEYKTAGSIVEYLKVNNPDALVPKVSPATQKAGQKADERMAILDKFEQECPEALCSVRDFLDIPSFSDRLKYICTVVPENVRDKFAELVGDVYSRVIRILGERKIESLSYRRSELLEECNNVEYNLTVEEKVKNKILSTFLLGEDYTPPYIKSSLRSIFDTFGYKSTSTKATILLKYFVMKESKKTVGDTRVRAYRIMSVKE